MIPAIGIAIYNRPDLLVKCLRSVPPGSVGRVLIVNNGELPGLFELACSILSGERGPIGRMGTDVSVFHEGNLGVAGAWNRIQREVFDELKLDSVLICGNDIEWAPGDLDILARTVEEFPAADFVFGNHSYSNFLVKRSGWEKVGAFDENIELAYLEDGDHWQRIIRSGAEGGPDLNHRDTEAQSGALQTTKAIHAAGLRATHAGSQTIQSDAEYGARVRQQQERNWDYYARKWGCPKWSSGAETFATPFNEGGPVNAWRLMGERLSRPWCFKQWPMNTETQRYGCRL